MTDGNSAYAGEFEGLAPYGVPHATGAKEDWLLEIRIGSRANDASWVTDGDRVGGDIFCEDRGDQVVKRISLSGYSKRLA